MLALLKVVATKLLTQKVAEKVLPQDGDKPLAKGAKRSAWIMIAAVTILGVLLALGVIDVPTFIQLVTTVGVV